MANKNGEPTRAEKALQAFVDQLVERMEDASRDLSWTKGWIGGSKRFLGLPQNIKGNTYLGSNALMLQLHTMSKGYNMPVFMTAKQANELGAHVNKGEKSTNVIKAGINVYDKKGKRVSTEFYDKLSDEEKKNYRVFPYIKSFWEFNIDQTNFKEVHPDRYEALIAKFQPEMEVSMDTKGMYQNEALDNVIGKEGAWICPIKEISGSDAFYIPSTNQINIPAKANFNVHPGNVEETFKDGQEFYSTALHEMAHSTGHESQLSREGITTSHKFGDPVYAKEELVAELTAAMVSNAMGFDKRITENSAAYLKSWSSKLKKDPRYIVSVMADVNKASRLEIERIDVQRKALGQKPLMDGNLDGVEERKDNEQQLSDIEKTAAEEKAKLLEGAGLKEKEIYYCPLTLAVDNISLGKLWDDGKNEEVISALKSAQQESGRSWGMEDVSSLGYELPKEILGEDDGYVYALGDDGNFVMAEKVQRENLLLELGKAEVTQEEKDFIKDENNEPVKTEEVNAKSLGGGQEEIAVSKDAEEVFYAAADTVIPEYSEDFDAYRENGNKTVMLNTARDWMRQYDVDVKQWQVLEPSEVSKLNIIAEDDKTAVAYHENSGNYDILPKLTRQEILDDIKSSGLDENASSVVKGIAYDDIARQFSELDSSSQIVFPNDEYLDFKYNRDTNKIELGHYMNAGMAVDHEFDYDISLTLRDNMEIVTEELMKLPQYQKQEEISETEGEEHGQSESQESTVEVDPRDEKKFYTSFSFMQMQEDTEQFEKLRQEGKYDELLSLASEYDQESDIDLDYIKEHAHSYDGDDVVTENDDYAVVYNGEVGGTYDLLKKVSENDIREKVEREGGLEYNHRPEYPKVVWDIQRTMVKDEWKNAPDNSTIEMESGDVLKVAYNSETDTMEITDPAKGEEPIHTISYDYTHSVGENFGYAFEEMGNWPEYQAKEMETISPETERSDMEGKLYYEVFNEDRDMEDSVSHKFESLHRKADEMGMLSLANEIDKGFPLEQKHVNLRPLENDETLPETILASDGDHTVTYSEDMDLYFVYRKVDKEDIVRDIEENGISSDATREVLDVARENELKNHPTGLKPYVESMKDNTDVLSGDLTLLPKYGVAHRAFEDSLHLVDELDKVKNSPNEYDRVYKTTLQKDIIKNSDLLKSELKKGVETYSETLKSDISKLFDLHARQTLEGSKVTINNGESFTLDELPKTEAVRQELIQASFKSMDDALGKTKQAENDGNQEEKIVFLAEFLKHHLTLKEVFSNNGDYSHNYHSYEKGIDRDNSIYSYFYTALSIENYLESKPEKEEKDYALAEIEDHDIEDLVSEGEEKQAHLNYTEEADEIYKRYMQRAERRGESLVNDYKEAQKLLDRGNLRDKQQVAHEDSNIETNVVADAKHIAATGVPMNRAEKIAKLQADGMAHEDMHREQDEQAAREQKEKEQQQRKEEEKRKQETEKKESKPSMAVSHAAILLAALTQAEENKGVWMNKGYRQNASFLYNQTPIQGYNNVIMNLHAEQQGYHTNVYTNFDGAKENGTPVLAGQQSLPFSWTNWKYVNQSDENVVLTSRQYHALAKEDRMLYAPRAERSAKIIFNIDQTTMPSAQYDAWIGLVKEKGDNNETLKIDKETSLFNQYSEISKKHPDVVILMHDGDAYKSYKGSARKINEAIGLPLGKAEYRGEQVDFVEFSRYKLDSYLTKLNAAKTRVALCDQLQSPRLVKSTISPEKVLGDAYQTALSFAKAEGMKYERVMVVQDAEYDVASNTLKVSGMSTPGKMASADSIDKANDIYRKLAMITGTESRLDRSGRNHLTPIDDVKYDKLVQEIAAGVMMARQGLPATISKENMELIPYWKMEITENPRMMGIIERDVNNSIEVIDSLAMGEKPDYRKMRGKMPEKMPMRKEDYTVIKELNKHPSMGNKEFVLVKDKVTNTASVILPKGASLKVDNEVQGMRKDRIAVVLKKEGIENVTFHNAGGSLGLKEQNAFFKDKEISVVKLKRFEFIKREPIDVRPLIKKSEEPRIQRFRMIKDEDGKYFFHIKPEGEKGFCVAPEKKYVNSLFEAIKSHDPKEVAKMTKSLSGQFYKLATEHEDVKRDFITPRKVEGIDYGRIRGANISYTGTGKDDGVISVYIDGVRQSSPITKPQLDKFFCSDDKNAYKTALAAVVFEQTLRRETSQEQDLGFNMQEEQDAGMKRSNSSDDEKSNDKSEGLKAEPSPERRGGMRMH